MEDMVMGEAGELYGAGLSAQLGNSVTLGAIGATAPAISCYIWCTRLFLAVVSLPGHHYISFRSFVCKEANLALLFPLSCSALTQCCGCIWPSLLDRSTSPLNDLVLIPMPLRSSRSSSKPDHWSSARADQGTFWSWIPLWKRFWHLNRYPSDKQGPGQKHTMYVYENRKRSEGTRRKKRNQLLL